MVCQRPAVCSQFSPYGYICVRQKNRCLHQIETIAGDCSIRQATLEYDASKWMLFANMGIEGKGGRCERCLALIAKTYRMQKSRKGLFEITNNFYFILRERHSLRYIVHANNSKTWGNVSRTMIGSTFKRVTKTVFEICEK